MTKPIPFIENHYYHVYNRGNNHEALFYTGPNRQYFLNLIAKYIILVAEPMAYCLLIDHFHLLLKIRSDVQRPISEHFRRLFLTYSQAINKEQKRMGSLFQKPFQRKPITTEDQLLQTIYYIHFNSVKHNISQDFINYPWNSYQHIINRNSSLIAVDTVLNVFGNKRNFIEMHNLAFEEFLTNKGKDAIASSDGILPDN